MQREGRLISIDLKDFDYDLPEGLIAQFPCERRDEARLMVLRKEMGSVEDCRFRDIIDYLEPDDLLLLNDTKVIPARLFGRRESGGRRELLLLRPSGRGWECLIRGGNLKDGERIHFPEGISGVMKGRGKDGTWVIEFETDRPILEVLERIGKVPLPPYIRRDATDVDRERYQTVYARRPGAVAAPTAGLHFTEELLEGLRRKGIRIETVTLHVGWGTFKPVKEEDICKGRLHREEYEVPWRAFQAIREAKEKGRRVVAVGTTVTRALETAFANPVRPLLKGESDLFIMPGYRFRVIDALLTNFHLPRSTPLMLVSAFAGRDFIMGAYRRAIAKGYRFYSYGDAMLIL